MCCWVQLGIGEQNPSLSPSLEGAACKAGWNRGRGGGASAPHRMPHTECPPSQTHHTPPRSRRPPACTPPNQSPCLGLVECMMLRLVIHGGLVCGVVGAAAPATRQAVLGPGRDRMHGPADRTPHTPRLTGHAIDDHHRQGGLPCQQDRREHGGRSDIAGVLQPLVPRHAPSHAVAPLLCTDPGLGTRRRLLDCMHPHIHKNPRGCCAREYAGVGECTCVVGEKPQGCPSTKFERGSVVGQAGGGAGPSQPLMGIPATLARPSGHCSCCSPPEASHCLTDPSQSSCGHGLDAA